MNFIKLVLASASPRRKTLLKQIGLSFTVHPSTIPEPPYTGSNPSKYAQNLASLKAAEVAIQFPDAMVIGADTIVVVDDKVLGKPRDGQTATDMLNMLSGRAHQVITGYSIQCKNLNIMENQHVMTVVNFRPLSPDEIGHYIATGNPFDKAGAYGIQDYSGIFVDRIEGCFYNVVGLPLSDFSSKLSDTLSQHKLHID